MCPSTNIYAQAEQDSLAEAKGEAAGDDPSQFFTRVELFNEFQHHHGDINLNQSTLRTIVQIGKRFTTRLDIPVVYNSFSSQKGYYQFGIGDNSFRILGYKIIQSAKSVLTASIECSLNTARSPLLGTGKNMIIPVITYTDVLNKKNLLAFVLQQVKAFSGDKTRDDVSFSKLQVIMINTWSKKMWTVLAATCYVDYVKGGASMNLEGRLAYASSPRVNFWAQAGTGIFGDFVLHYQWSIQLGYRYFLFRKATLNARRKV